MNSTKTMRNFVSGQESDDISNALFSFLPNADQQIMASLNKEAWGFNYCIMLNNCVQNNDMLQLQKLLTSLYINMEFFSTFFNNAHDEIFNKWRVTLKNILNGSSLNPVYRAVTYTILLKCISHKSNPDTKNLLIEKKQYEKEFNIQLRILEVFDYDMATSIEGYYGKLLDRNDLYENCLKKYSGPVIDRKNIDANYACILLKPFIESLNLMFIQKVCMDGLKDHPDYLAKNNTIPLVCALLMLSDEKKRTIMSHDLMEYVGKLLAACKYGQYKSEIAFIVSTVLKNSTEKECVAKLNSMKSEGLAQLRITHFNSVSYDGNPMEETVTLIICKLLNNSSLTSDESLILLKKIPYSALRIPFGTKKYSIETMIFAFRQAFLNLNHDHVLDYIKNDLFPLLMIQDQFDRRDMSNFSDIFAKALSYQKPETLIAIIELLLIYKNEEKYRCTEFFHYSHLGDFLKIIILALPKQKQREQLTKNITPLLLQDKKKTFILNMLVNMLDASIQINTPSLFMFQIVLKKHSNGLIDLIKKESDFANELLSHLQHMHMQALVKDNYSNKNISSAICTVFLVMGSDRLALEYISKLILNFRDNGLKSQPSALLNKFVGSKYDNLIFLKKNNADNIILFILMLSSVIKDNDISYIICKILLKCYINSAELSLQSLLGMMIATHLGTMNKDIQIKSISKLKLMVNTIDNHLTNNTIKIKEKSDEYMLECEHAGMILSRNMYIIAIYYRLFPLSSGLKVFIDNCYSFISRYPKCHIEELANDILLLISSVSPDDYKLRAMRELNFSEYDHDKLISLLKTLNVTTMTEGIDILWTYISKHVPYNVSRIVQEVIKVIPDTEKKLYLLKLVFNKACKDNDQKYYDLYFDTARFMLPISKSRVEVNAILGMNFYFLGKTISDHIRHQAILVLASVKNNALLAKYFKTLYSLLDTMSCKSDIYNILSRMLTSLSDSELNSLFPVIYDSSENCYSKEGVLLNGFENDLQECRVDENPLMDELLDNNNRDLLFRALEKNEIDMDQVQSLLEKGADVTLKNTPDFEVTSVFPVENNFTYLLRRNTYEWNLRYYEKSHSSPVLIKIEDVVGLKGLLSNKKVITSVLCQDARRLIKPYHEKIYFNTPLTLAAEKLGFSSSTSIYFKILTSAREQSKRLVPDKILEEKYPVLYYFATKIVVRVRVHLSKYTKARQERLNDPYYEFLNSIYPEELFPRAKELALIYQAIIKAAKTHNYSEMLLDLCLIQKKATWTWNSFLHKGLYEILEEANQWMNKNMYQYFDEYNRYRDSVSRSELRNLVPSNYSETNTAKDGVELMPIKSTSISSTSTTTTTTTNSICAVSKGAERDRMFSGKQTVLQQSGNIEMKEIRGSRVEKK